MVGIFVRLQFGWIRFSEHLFCYRVAMFSSICVLAQAAAQAT